MPPPDDGPPRPRFSVVSHRRRDGGQPRLVTRRRRPRAARDVSDVRRRLRRRLLRLVVVAMAASILAPALGRAIPGTTYVIASGSMSPAIPVGALVIAFPGEPGVGDVVVYHAAAGGVQVHRVVAVRRDDEGTRYLTRGDANPAADAFLVEADDVAGVVQRVVPGFGRLWLVPPVLQAAGLLLLMAAYLGIALWEARVLLRRPPMAAAAVLLAATLLVPAGHAAVDTTFPTARGTVAVAATPLPLSAGTVGSATVAADQNSAGVSVGAPILWKEVQMWGCAPGATSPPSCLLDPAGITYATQAGSITKVNAADLDGGVTFYLEASMQAAVGLGIFVQLFDKTGNAAVAGTEISTISTTAAVVRSAGFALSGDREYQFQSRETGVGAGKIHSVKLVSAQGFPTKTVTQVPMSGAGQTTSATFAVPVGAGRWLYDGGQTDGTVTAYFEFVGDVSANTGTVRLMDRTTSTQVASLTTTSTATVLVRSTAITLTSGDEYEVEFKVGGNKILNLRLARVVILQTGFTSTVRYEDLAWTATTTSTSFQGIGYPGRYHMGTEWGAATAYLEATLSNTQAGSTTTARLYDNAAAAAVAGSDIAVTGTTRTRIRSVALALDLADAATYALQLKASANTAEVRTAWLVVHQAGGKTFDHVLEAANDVAGACTWSFTLEHSSSSGLARISAATLSVRGGAGLAVQVVVSSGVVTQATGPAVSVPFGSSVQHVVSTRPASAGTSTIDADLRGACGGVHTRQPLTFTLG